MYDTQAALLARGDYFSGMGLQRFFSDAATLPQLKQMCFGFLVISLI
jgi:hypothetical protein